MKSGKLRALGVSGKARSPLAPDVPTIDEAGCKGYEMSYWFAAYAPAGTPPAVVTKLNQLLVKAAKSDTASTFYQSTGTEVFTSTPARAGQVPGSGIGQMGPDHQVGEHPAGVIRPRRNGYARC